MYLTYSEITTMKIKELPSALQVSIIKAICNMVRLNFTESFFNRVNECTIREVDLYVPDLYSKYIHILV